MISIRMTLTLLIFSCASMPITEAQGASQPQADNRALVRLDRMEVKQAAFAKSSATKPLILTSLEQAKTFFAPAQLKKISDNTNFDKQVLMVFAWRGSGQDRLDALLKESFPPQLSMKYTRGRTRDLRSHAAIFVVARNVIWNGKALSKAKPQTGDYIKVEIQGKLQTGVLAIGGETTGTLIQANGVQWEVDLGNDRMLVSLAEKLNGKTVMLTGKLRVQQGIETGKRWIVTAASLRPVNLP